VDPSGLLGCGGPAGEWNPFVGAPQAAKGEWRRFGAAGL
jgi:hypothetical protein